MRRKYIKHRSCYLQDYMELLILGHAGAPVLVFPTSNGRFYQWEDFSMIAALNEPITKGWLQLFCVDSIDHKSWYGFHLSPREQLTNHLDYEAYLYHEILPLIKEYNPTRFLITTGTSFGAFHALNFALRHPEAVNRVVALSGDYDTKKYLDGYFDLDVYYNSPQDYLGGMNDPADIARLKHLEIILTAGDWDFCLEPTLEVARSLKRLGIPHRCDIWEGGHLHDWPLWKQQIKFYL